MVESNQLRFSDEAWLGHIHRGLLMVRVGRIGLLSLLGMHLLVGLLGLLILEKDTDTRLEASLESLLHVLLGLMVVAAIVVATGAWMAFEPEPRDVDSHDSTLAARTIAALSLPALGLWWAYGVHDAATGVTIAYGAAAVCFTVASSSLFLLLNRAKQLESRVAGVDDARMRTLTGYTRLLWMLIGVTLVGSVLGPLRWFDAGAWTPPDRETLSYGLFTIAGAWALATGVLATTSRRVHEEITAQIRINS